MEEVDELQEAIAEDVKLKMKQKTLRDLKTAMSMMVNQILGHQTGNSWDIIISIEKAVTFAIDNGYGEE